jgi:hypothetical protein
VTRMPRYTTFAGRLESCARDEQAYGVQESCCKICVAVAKACCCAIIAVTMRKLQGVIIGTRRLRAFQASFQRDAGSQPRRTGGEARIARRDAAEWSLHAKGSKVVFGNSNCISPMVLGAV